MNNKKYRKKVTAYSIVVGNLIVFGLILAFVLQNSSSNKGTLNNINTNDVSNTLVSNPLDQLSSAQIALTVSKMTDSIETVPITNQADSQKAELAMASSTSGNIVSKPQIINTNIKSIANLIYYVTQPGDTVAGLASKFGVTSNSIIWSNNLTGLTLPAGTKLAIPPINGIVYTVKSGDTVAGLASKYSSNANDILAFNNDDLSGLIPGQTIVIPNGSVYTPTYVATYGGNGYDFGYCTWYVATQISVPTNWGNASTWAYYARLAGWNVSSTPSVGAIAQNTYVAGGLGHVAIVMALSDASHPGQIEIRDMNGLAGWDKVGIGWVPISDFQNFITR